MQNINFWINIGLYTTYVLFGAAMVALLFFAIKQFVMNIKRSRRTLIGMVALLVLFGASYAISSPVDIPITMFEKVGTSYDLSQLIGSGLIMTYLLFGVLVITLVAVEVMRPFKK